MSSEQSLKTVSAFNKLPNTPEKEEIERQYLEDEIGNFEFFSMANAYLSKVTEAK